MPRKIKTQESIPDCVLDKQYDETLSEFVYLIKWKQPPGSYLHDSWEQENNLLKSNFADLIIHYNESLEKFCPFTPIADEQSKSVEKSKVQKRQKRKQSTGKQGTSFDVLEDLMDQKNSGQKNKSTVKKDLGIMTRSKAIGRVSCSQPVMRKKKESLRTQNPQNIITILKTSLDSQKSIKLGFQEYFVETDTQMTQPIIPEPQIAQTQPLEQELLRVDFNNSVSFQEASTLISQFDYSMNLNSCVQKRVDDFVEQSPLNFLKTTQVFSNDFLSTPKTHHQPLQPSNIPDLDYSAFQAYQQPVQAYEPPVQQSFTPLLISTEEMKMQYPHLYIQWLECENIRLRNNHRHQLQHNQQMM